MFPKCNNFANAQRRITCSDRHTSVKNGNETALAVMPPSPSWSRPAGLAKCAPRGSRPPPPGGVAMRRGVACPPRGVQSPPVPGLLSCGTTKEEDNRGGRGGLLSIFAVCCYEHVLHCVAVCCSCFSVLQCVAMCCSVLLVCMCCSVLQYIAHQHALQCLAVSCA